jgi:hypothetical protein
MTGRYAANTEVTVERSKGELEKTLARYGAHAFMSGWDQTRAMVEFLVDERRVRFVLPLPDRGAEEFRLTPAGRRQRSQEDATRAWEQACRQAWRALNLVVKAKLEAVDAGITTFEAEFLAHLVLPGGQTIGDTVLPQLDQLGPSGPLLALGSGR